jgi:homoserine dehydrogenase
VGKLVADSVKPIRIWLVGLGTVGRWLARALDAQSERLARSYGIGVAVVGLASQRDGFIYDPKRWSVASRWSPPTSGLSPCTGPSSRSGRTARASRFAPNPPSCQERRVEGQDAVAKVMILSALVFGRQLRREQVACRGITDLDRATLDQAASSGGRIKHVATLEFGEPDGVGEVTARVEPELVGREDLLARIDGTTNALVFQASPIGQVALIGPGAGPQLAGQGTFSDLIAVARSRPTT